MKLLNWPLVAGFLLSLVAFFSYLFFFYRFPITRDVPWVNFILFAVAIAMLTSGVRRAQRKVLARIVAGLGIAIAAGFLLIVTVLSRQIPSGATAIPVGQRAPEFTLTDTNGKRVAFAELTASAPKGVLLIFYRGYW